MDATLLTKSQCNELLKSKMSQNGNPNCARTIATAKRWRPPRGYSIKINCDAQFDCNTGRGTVSAICRNKDREVFTGAMDRVFATSALVAEALGVRFAPQLPSNLSFEEIVIESDFLEIVEAC